MSMVVLAWQDYEEWEKQKEERRLQAQVDLKRDCRKIRFMPFRLRILCEDLLAQQHTHGIWFQDCFKFHIFLFSVHKNSTA